MIFILDFNEVDRFIYSQQFIEAENILVLYLQKEDIADSEYSMIYYYLGNIYNHFLNEDQNKSKALKYFKNSINYNCAYPLSYFEISKIEDDKNIALRYLRLGLKEYPLNPYLIVELLKYVDDEEIKTISKQLFDCSFDEDSFFYVLDVLLEINQHDVIIELLNEKKVLINDNYDQLSLVFLNGYSNLILKRNLNSAVICFKVIFDNDIDNIYNYYHYILYSYSLLLTNNNELALNIINQIPLNNAVFTILDGPDYRFTNFDFSSVFKEFFISIKNKLTNKNTLNKINVLEALFYYNSYLYYDEIQYTKTHINYIEKYIKIERNNKFLFYTLFNMYCNFKEYNKAFNILIEIILNEWDPIEGNCFFDYEIKNFDTELLSEISLNLDIAFKEIPTYKYESLIKYVIDPIASELYNSNREDRYSLLSCIAHLYNKYNCLNYSNQLFNFAYSLSENGDKELSEQIYRKVLNTNNENSAVLNNLGNLVKNRNNYIEAESLYERAYNLTENDEIIIFNYNKIKHDNIIRRKSIDYLNDEKLSFVIKLYDLSNHLIDNTLIIDYFNSSNSLIHNYFNKDEIYYIQNKKYIEKSEDKKSNKYYFNLYLIEYFDSILYIINLCKNNERLCESITINYLIGLGITNKIFEKLKSIYDERYYYNIVIDLNECILSMFNKNKKSAIVIVGSIIEALLFEKLYSSGIKSFTKTTNSGSVTKKIEEATLYDLIEKAKEKDIFKNKDNKDYHLAHVLRDYRNLIHPNKNIRSGIALSDSDINIVWNSLILILTNL